MNNQRDSILLEQYRCSQKGPIQGEESWCYTYWINNPEPSWWLSGIESACQCRRHGFNRLSRMIPHALEQQSLCATTIEPVLWSPGAATIEPTCYNHWSPQAREPMLCNKRSHCNENNVPCNYTVAPLAAAREKSMQQGGPVQQGGPSTAKKIILNE